MDVMLIWSESNFTHTIFEPESLKTEYKTRHSIWADLYMQCMLIEDQMKKKKKNPLMQRNEQIYCILRQVI